MLQENLGSTIYFSIPISIKLDNMAFLGRKRPMSGRAYHHYEFEYIPVRSYIIVTVWSQDKIMNKHARNLVN